MSETTAGPTAPANGRADLRERPTGELVKDLSTHVSTLVRQELELAKVELSAKGKQAGIGAGMFGGAGLFALFGFGALTAAAIAALSTAMATWLAALIVAVVYFAIAGIVALLGKRRVKHATPLAPERAIDSTKQDIETTKARVKEARS
jgi:uncharacterized membrane protein YqjE